MTLNKQALSEGVSCPTARLDLAPQWVCSGRLATPEVMRTSIMQLLLANDCMTAHGLEPPTGQSEMLSTPQTVSS